MWPTRKIYDTQIASIILFMGSSLFLLGSLVTINKRHEDNTSDAKVAQESMDVIHSIFVFAGSCGLMYLSFSDGWRRLHLNLKLFDPTKEPFYKRYFTGNVLLISVWLFFLPSLLDLIFPVWGYINELNSGITTTRYNYALVYVQLISSLVVVIFVIFFWVYATLPGNMRQNGGRGPYEFLYYLSVLGLLYLKLVRPLVSGSAQENSYQPLHQKTESFDTEYEPTSDTSFLNTVWRKCWDVFGSDYTVGVLIFALSSTAGLVISCIMAFDNSTDPEYIFGIVCSLVFTLGTYVLLYASHPRNMRKDNWAGSRDIHKLSMSLCGASEVDDDVNLLQ